MWENIHYLVLALTIIGQITVGGNFLLGQSLWLVANIITVTRCFVLKRPTADKVKDCTLLAITIGIVTLYLFTH